MDVLPLDVGDVLVYNHFAMFVRKALAALTAICALQMIMD